MRETPLRGLFFLVTAALFVGCGGPVTLSIDDTAAGGGDVASGGEEGGDDTADDGGSGSSGGPYLCINEFMASNDSGLQDNNGEFVDWIELYNPTDIDIDLEGWTITDDFEEPGKHVLEDLVIEAGAYMVLIADGDTDEGDDHVGFGLDADGEAIGLYNADGEPIDRLEFEPQLADSSAARTPDASTTWALTDEPTPGESNGSGK